MSQRVLEYKLKYNLHTNSFTQLSPIKFLVVGGGWARVVSRKRMRAAVGRSSDDFSDLVLTSAGCSLEDSLRLEEDSGSAPLEVKAAPEEWWPEHAVPFTVSAKALLHEAAEVSATAAPRRSSYPRVLDRGRGSSLALLDTTGDGQPNLVVIDTTGDGFVDSLAVDTTGDGRVDHVSSAGTDPDSIHLVDTTVRLDRIEPEACLCSCTWLTTLLTRQGDGLVDAVTLSARGGVPRVHDAQVAVVQSSTRPSLVPQTQPEMPLLGINDAARVPRDDTTPFSPLSSPLCSARSSRSALSEGGALALARSRDASRRASCQQVSDTAAQVAPSLSKSTAAELVGAALGETDGRHCSRCEEMTLVASIFGGLCYYCHSFPHAETWRQLRARFVLIVASRASPSSSKHPPRVSSIFDLPGFELQV